MQLTKREKELMVLCSALISATLGEHLRSKHGVRNDEATKISEQYAITNCKMLDHESTSAVVEHFMDMIK